MRYFVTGGASYIGSYLVDRLIDNRYAVTIFYNLSSGRMEFIQHHKNDKNFRFIQSDMLVSAPIQELRG